jgi:hypothetical protein
VVVVDLAAKELSRPAGDAPAACDHPEDVISRMIPERQLGRPARRIGELESAALNRGIGRDDAIAQRDLGGR